MIDKKIENIKSNSLSAAQPSAAAPAKEPIAPAAADETLHPLRLHGKSLDSIDKDDLPMTAGDKFYLALQQIGGKGLIIASTAVIGFAARYGKDHYGPIPNLFKKLQDGLNKHLVNPLHPTEGTSSMRGEISHRIAGAFGSTMVISWGGVVFAPVIKAMENNREKIVNWYNKKWGQPGDIEIAHKALKDEPQQDWLDIFKGRIVTWTSIWLSFVAMDMALGKGKLFGKGKDTEYRFDQYEEGFGRWLAGWKKSGKALWETPLAHDLTDAQKQHKWYQFGKITALDFYATNAGIIIWSFFSRKSARSRQQKLAEKLKAEQNVILNDAADGINEPPPEQIVSPSVSAVATQSVQEEKMLDTVPEKVSKSFTDAVTPRTKTDISARTPGFTESLAAKEASEPNVGMGA